MQKVWWGWISSPPNEIDKKRIHGGIIKCRMPR